MRIRTKFVLVNIVVVGLALVSVTTASLMQFNRELGRQAMISQDSRLKTFWELLRH